MHEYELYMAHYLCWILEHEKCKHVQASVNRNWKLWKINPFVLKSFQAIIHSYRKVCPKVMLPLFHNPRALWRSEAGHDLFQLLFIRADDRNNTGLSLQGLCTSWNHGIILPAREIYQIGSYKAYWLVFLLKLSLPRMNYCIALNKTLVSDKAFSNVSPSQRKCTFSFCSLVVCFYLTPLFQWD